MSGLLVGADGLESNIQKVATYARDRGLAVRPHQERLGQSISGDLERPAAWLPGFAAVRRWPLPREPRR